MDIKLLSYQSGQGVKAGLLAGDKVIDLQGTIPGVDTSSVLSILQAWGDVLPRLDAIAAKPASSTPLAGVKLTAPILYPTNIFCAAANYQDHFREMSGKDVDKTKINPYFFLKVARQTVIGPGAAIKRPHITQKLDWEAEIAVVIGRGGRNIKPENAYDHIAGYMIMNDLSARDYIRRADWPNLASDWLWQKSFDTSAPMGPWITLARDVPDPQNLFLKTWVNGNIEQDTHSKHMVFTVREPEQHVHIPLLISPYGYSTYRGA